MIWWRNNGDMYASSMPANNIAIKFQFFSSLAILSFVARCATVASTLCYYVNQSIKINKSNP